MQLPEEENGMTRLRHLVRGGSSRVRMRLDRRGPRFGRGVLLPLLAVLPPLRPRLAGGAFARVDTWTTNGPEGGEVQALAIDPANPATLYAGTAGGGVSKSTNGGGSWKSVNNGLTSTIVTALAIDPSAPATLYAGTYGGTEGGGVFKSTNGGESWTAINTGLNKDRKS